MVLYNAQSSETTSLIWIYEKSIFVKTYFTYWKNDKNSQKMTVMQSLLFMFSCIGSTDRSNNMTPKYYIRMKQPDF